MNLRPGHLVAATTPQTPTPSKRPMEPLVNPEHPMARADNPPVEELVMAGRSPRYSPNNPLRRPNYARLQDSSAQGRARGVSDD